MLVEVFPFPVLDFWDISAVLTDVGLTMTGETASTDSLGEVMDARSMQTA